MKKTNIILKSLTSIGLMLIPFLTYAADSGSTDIGITIPNPTKAGSTLMEVIVALLNGVVMPIAAVGVVMWIVWAGFSYLTAQGNSTKIQEANQRLLWSLIGAGILLGAAGISTVVQNTVKAVL